MKRTIITVLLAALISTPCSSIALASGTAGLPFSDVSENDWCYSYIQELYEAGVVNGYDNGTFGKEDPVSWGQMFKLILLTIGCEEPEPMAGKHWAYPYISPALENRLVFWFDSENLDAIPTRLEVAQMTARALDLVSIAGQSPYGDCDDGYVVKLYEKGIMNGVTDEDGVRNFLPDQSITRAEVAAILCRIRAIDVSEGMFRYSNYWLDVLPDVEPMEYDPSLFSRQDGVMTYAGGETTLGVDVSGFQGNIDWEAVKASGIDFALIRVGGRFIVSGGLYDDSYFTRNIEGALAAGLKVGVYFFSQAITEEEALEEADFVLARIQDYDITYPVVFDWEYLGGSAARTYGVEPDVISRCAIAFCQRMEQAGYTPMVYFNAYCGYIKYNLSMIDDYAFWYAEYSNRPTFRYNFQMWQYTSSGRVNGISGDVDMNLCFVSF